MFKIYPLVLSYNVQCTMSNLQEEMLWLKHEFVPLQKNLTNTYKRKDAYNVEGVELILTIAY